MACAELLVHADDALQGLRSRLEPPEDLARAALGHAYSSDSAG
jgi:hypothetical protein